jgi:lipopolysaccharide/colanic/teichoic acid biosynthesis glycosyltransferase
VTAWEWTQRGLALTALVALSPLLLVLYVAVRVTSPGPFLFRQARRCRGGEPITVLKIRTLGVGSERKTTFGVRQDNPSITPIGRVLRELKLDELPQLWNVVRGDMALVGPRPIPLRLEDELANQIPGFERRHLVKPGLTNLGQVTVVDNGVGEDMLRDWRLRFEAERHYLRHKSCAYDVVLIALTVLFITRRLGRAAQRKLGWGGGQ